MGEKCIYTDDSPPPPSSMPFMTLMTCMYIQAGHTRMWIPQTLGFLSSSDPQLSFGLSN
jgi:hypothetical protein